MLVVFIGGVTFAEISALRFLSAQVCQGLFLESAVLQARLFLGVYLYIEILAFQQIKNFLKIGIS